MYSLFNVMNIDSSLTIEYVKISKRKRETYIYILLCIVLKIKEINSQRTNLYIDVHIRINPFTLVLYCFDRHIAT